MASAWVAPSLLNIFLVILLNSQPSLAIGRNQLPIFSVAYSEISSYRYLVPKYCQDSFETIQCFDKCKNDPYVTEILLGIKEEADIEHSRRRIAEIALQLKHEEINRTKSIPTLDFNAAKGHPCDNKCETDPEYWSCVEDCNDRDPTAFWESTCFTVHDGNVSCNATHRGFLDGIECKQCLYNSTRDQLLHTCEIAYFPGETQDRENLCYQYSFCNDTTSGTIGDNNVIKLINNCAQSIQNDLEMMKLCVNDNIMIAQRECCYSEVIRNETGCKNDTAKCDEFCMKILAPRLCREKCKMFRNQTIQTCIDETCNFYHSLNETVCGHCDNHNPQYEPLLKTFEAERNCTETSPDCEEGGSLKSCMQTCLPYGPYGNGSIGGSGPPPNVSQYLLDNCYNEYYIRNFSLYAVKNRRKFYWPMQLPDPDESKWMLHFKQPFECVNCTRQDRETQLSIDEVKDLCEKNPFRTIDVLACAFVNPDPTLQSLQKHVAYDPSFVKCLDDPEYEVTLLHLYKMIFEYETNVVCQHRYCEVVGKRRDNLPENHPNGFTNMYCSIYECQETGKSPYCKPGTDGYVIDLESYGICRWKIDFAKWNSPYRLWSTYFNELNPAEIRHKLEYPDSTQILSKAMFEGKTAFYTFPYFIIIRSVCDGGYYTSENYKYIAETKTPIVEVKYGFTTNRNWPRSLFQGVFKTALIDLKRSADDDENLIPENPRKLTISHGDYDEILGCPDGICYPAFAAPLVLLNIPIFGIKVLDQETINLRTKTVYVSQYHTRVAAGRGAIYDPGERSPDTGVWKNVVKPPAHPGHLFPVERSTFAVDQELNYHQNCFANDITDKLSNEYNERKCPELEHTLDDFDTPYAKNYFAPLDPEDILRTQYAYGTAPTQAIAGFYDPKYIIIGDADMNKFDFVDWSKLLVDLERDKGMISCIQYVFKNREHHKPIYSQMDRTDTTYPLKFFRQRYAPKAFYSKSSDQVADTAIFEAIGLEDRLLLITTKGLVSFYGHSNYTVHKDKQWSVQNNETLNKCFKIVRILPSSQPTSDLIVGVTYNYIIKNARTSEKHKNLTASIAVDQDVYEEVAQEIWVGKYAQPGEEIQWRQINEKRKESVYVDKPLKKKEPDSSFAAFKPDKDPGLPQSMRVANPKSQIDAICYKAFLTQIDRYKETKDKVRLVDEINWCVAVDATPVQLKEDTIQVLVRMRTYYNADNSRIYFYIVATHTLNPLISEVEWVIDSIIPRYPCIDEHKEAVANVFAFDRRYFDKHYRGGTVINGCHAAHEDRLDFHIFLHGMTYPRALSNHLFLYGSRLLQSTNNGKNFMFLKGFPQKFHSFVSFDQGGGGNAPGGSSQIKRNRPVHRIIKMAFDDGGHYAFLTNKLELWMGSTGSIDQIRLRPSPLRSMVQMGLSKVKNVHDGVPFTLDYDSNNKLYEMVAIVGDNGHVTKIMKRYVKQWELLKVKTILEKFDRLSKIMYDRRVREQTLSDDLQKPYIYDISEWNTFCNYHSPSLMQNFSKSHSRFQATFFPHPDQHFLLGKAHRPESLLAFQAIAFTLVWESYFQTPTRFYAGEDEDPYYRWVLNRKSEAHTTMKTTMFSQRFPDEENTILIQPTKYKRIVFSRLHSYLLNQYYIDYNTTVELQMEFAVRNDLGVINTQFVEDQINAVELNVENSNGSVIQINTEREQRAHKSAVLFIIRMKAKRDSGLKQTLPGQNFIPVPITYHLIKAFGNCIPNQPLGETGDVIRTIARVGCPPNRDFVFDWNATLRSISLRGDRIAESKGLQAHGIGAECYHNEYVCFFARSPTTLYFEIFDESKQRHLPYTGKFIMRIIGGGTTRSSIRLFTQEEIDAFNIVGVSDASLIWSEWDSENHQKIDKVAQFYTESGKDGRRDVRESVLTSGTSVISWVCHTLSPCARVVPTETLEVVTWFRVFITNRDVDSDTLCLYEKEFDVMVYGFHPSPEFQLVSTVGFCALIMLILYVLYRCGRQNSKLWLSTKAGAKNWYFVVKDAIPKKLRYYELPLPEEPERHERPKKFRTFEDTPSREASFTSVEMGSDLENSSGNSSSTLDSNAASLPDSTSVLPQTTRLHTTAKQVVYDQLLLKRINNIVERNRALRTNLIKKASVNPSQEDFEQEFNFEKQFGRTVSQESAFTPPMPKDRKKKGIDKFL